MDYFVGLDVSLETVSVCIVNADGDILVEKKIEAEPTAIVAVLEAFGYPLKRVGLEAGPTSSWLYSELRDRGYPAICLECRHVKEGLRPSNSTNLSIDRSRCLVGTWVSSENS